MSENTTLNYSQTFLILLIMINLMVISGALFVHMHAFGDIVSTNNYNQMNEYWIDNWHNAGVGHYLVIDN